MLDLGATPQEGMIFHCAGQASGGWRLFDPPRNVKPSTNLMQE